MAAMTSPSVTSASRCASRAAAASSSALVDGGCPGRRSGSSVARRALEAPARRARVAAAGGGGRRELTGRSRRGLSFGLHSAGIAGRNVELGSVRGVGRAEVEAPTRRRRACVRSAAGGAGAAQSAPASSAADCVGLGLQLFKKGKVEAALQQFENALNLQPSTEEAQAALYNKACCHAAKEQGQQALDALREALGKHELKFSVILSDPDMAPFRAMPEFSELQEEATKGGADIGSGFRRDLKLIGEVRAPFRGLRKFLYLAFGMAAGISTIFTLPRLIGAFKGGEEAPDLLQTLTNLGINVGGGAVLVALYLWDQRQEETMLARISRDETLSRLPLRLGGRNVVELNQLRETSRPVILVGQRSTVDKYLKRAEAYREQLMERGVVIIPIAWDDGTQASSSTMGKSKGFNAAKKPTVVPETAAEQLDDFEKRAQEAATKRLQQVDRRFKAEAVSPKEWLQWVREQQKGEGLKPGEDVYLVLRLDGRLRKSGRGMPDWVTVLNELNPLDSFASKMER